MPRNTMRKATTATTTATATPPTRGAAPDLWERLAAPFAAEEVRSRRGPRGDLRYITARTARRRLNDVLGPANWSCRIEPADRWVRCCLTIILPDGRAVTREAIGGYPDMPAEEDRVKGGDSDAFKRACVLFGIGEYLYGDEPAEPAEPRPTDLQRQRPGRAAQRPARPHQLPRRPRVLRLAQGQRPPRPRRGDRRPGGPPDQIIHWTPEQIDLATVEILAGPARPLMTTAARGRGSPGLGAGDAAPAEGSDGAGRADEGMDDDRPTRTPLVPICSVPHPGWVYRLPVSKSQSL